MYERPPDSPSDQGNQSFSWDEQIARWIVSGKAKEVRMNYISLSLKGKKQYDGKIDDLNLPIVKGTTTYSIYEIFCF